MKDVNPVTARPKNRSSYQTFKIPPSSPTLRLGVFGCNGVKITRMFLGFLMAAGTFLALTGFAAQETRIYELSFDNKSGAGPAINPEFTFSLPQGVSITETGSNVQIENGKLVVVGPAAILPGESFNITVSLQGESGLLDHLENGKLVFDWQDDKFEGQGKTNLERTSTKPSLLANFRNNPEIVKTVKRVGVPLAVSAGGLGILSLGISASSVSASFAYNVAEFLRFVTLGFLRIKKRKPWGVVYNQITNKPIAGAMVKLFDAQYKKLKETQVTDKDGRFGFLVSPGAYFIKITRAGFREKQTEVITIQDPSASITLKIPVLVETQISEAKLKIINFWRSVARFIHAINPIILIFGTALSLFIAIITPNALNYVVLGIYAIMDLLKIIISARTIKSYGTIKDTRSNNALDLAIVRIYDAKSNWLLNTKVTDARGRFNFLTTPGSYYLSAVKNQYNPFESQVLDISKSGILNFDIKLESIT